MQESSRNLAIILAWLFMVSVLQLRPIDDVDIFWQIRAGKIIIEQGRLITTDLFTYTHYGEKVTTICWLAQIIFALIYSFGSWQAVQLFNSIIYASAFIVPLLSYRIKDISLFSLYFAVILAFLVALSNSSVRPQSLGLLCFALLINVFQADWRFKTKFIVSILIALLWQNLHPSLSVGIVTLITLIGAELFTKFYRKDFIIPWRQTIFILTLVILLLGTPAGWTIFKTTMINTEVARNWLGISEWLPPWHPSVITAMVLFWFALFLSLVLIIRLRKRLNLADFSIFIVVTCLTLVASRFAIFWAVAMIPILARWIDEAKPPKILDFSKDYILKKPYFYSIIITAVALALIIPSFFRSSIVDNQIPIRGVKFLKKVLPAGKIYNYREWGGILIFNGYPGWKLSIDGRLYLYELPEWIQYNSIALGKIPLQEVVDEHHPDAFFLRPSFHRNFIDILRKSSDWREIYADEYSIIFLNDVPENN